MFSQRRIRPIFWSTAMVSVGILTAVKFLPLAFGIALVIMCLYNFIIEVYVSLSFLKPGRRKQTFQGQNWQSHQVEHDDRKVQLVTYTQKEPSPLLILVHGWRASTSSVSDRGQWFVDRGWHVVMVELPSHGSSDDLPLWTAYGSMQAVQLACAKIEEFYTDGSITGVTYYGHSMGGFIGLRLASDEGLRIAGKPLSNMILESPMTMYSPILVEISTRLKIPSVIHSPYMKRMIARVNTAIQWEQTFTSVEEFDMPLWGLPKIPMLCVQAARDERLGMKHYDRLNTCYQSEELGTMLTSTRLETLTHSGARINAERNQTIADWLLSQ